MNGVVPENPTASSGLRRAACGGLRFLGGFIQFLLWYLMFLSFVIVYARGLELTDFRYVGF